MSYDYARGERRALIAFGEAMGLTYHGSVSGRLSSRQPNMQEIERPTSRFACTTRGCTRLAALGTSALCRACLSDERRRREQEPQR